MRKAFASALVFLAFIGAAYAASVNVGVYTLAADQITTAQTGSVQTTVTNLDGATAVSLVASFQYGSGGTTAAAVAQTSCDGGTVFHDVAYFAFTTSTAIKYANLSGLTAKATGAYAALAADGVNDGLLCPILRVIVTSTGTYANTILSVRASVR